MVRNYTLKIGISIIVVFKFYYCYLNHPLELVTDNVGKQFHSLEEKMVFWCDRWPYIHSVMVLHVSSGDLLLPIVLLEYFVIYIVKLNMFMNRKMLIIIVAFIHWDKLFKLYFLASFCYFHKHANIYLMGPNMKLLQQENICSMLKDVLKGKEKEDSANLHKSR